MPIDIEKVKSQVDGEHKIPISTVSPANDSNNQRGPDTIMASEKPTTSEQQVSSLQETKVDTAKRESQRTKSKAKEPATSPREKAKSKAESPAKSPAKLEISKRKTDSP